jgi:hypothetical protein
MILWIVCASEIKNTRVNRKILTSMCGIFRLKHIFISPVRKLETQKTDWSPIIKQLQQGMSFLFCNVHPTHEFRAMPPPVLPTIPGITPIWPLDSITHSICIFLFVSLSIQSYFTHTHAHVYYTVYKLHVT